ncbi:hypothetical protein G4Y79_05265 [Phototrophicus methaneseepsis]|uniref:Uncharacterized protein n=1 Tax=Phototrophicus methaneseepsis TaxID=2710758 RepID=A0A7S8IEL1_9CHLR|nr:hypothetical protein [Phototrophicus methaneseepsis]QPC83790.1 hypothetical protein G4Y79_05265 [Phototrophicus methaneseepsis]
MTAVTGFISLFISPILTPTISFVRHWFAQLTYEDKFGYYQLVAGLFTFLQPTRGVAWFIESQLPFISARQFGALMMLAGGVTIALSFYTDLSPRRQFEYKRWPIFVWFLYIMIAIIAALRPFDAPPDREPDTILLPGTVLIIYVFTADILISQLIRLRDYAIQKS